MKANIYELGHIYFAKGMIKAKHANRKIDNYFAGSYFLGALNFFLKFIYSFLFCNWRFPPQGKDYQGIVVYGPTRNNRLSLDPILEKVRKERMVLMMTERSFPSWRLYWYALPHIFDIIKDIKSASEENKRIIKFFFPKFWRLYGCPKVVKQIIDKYNPRMIILANDHLPFNHCLRLIANEKGIKTIYIQHAAAGLTFPPLQFSYSLLDGMDAFDKYKTIGNIKGNIYLCGGVRFDKIDHTLTRQDERLRIGVAINVVDDIDAVKNLCLYLKQCDKNGSPAIVTLRPHPIMSEKDLKEWCGANDIFFSSSRTESSFDFINKQSCLVANQSSIHLDAAMCRTPSIVFDLSKNCPKDLYGFVRNKLVTEAKTYEDIKDFIARLDSYSIEASIVQYYDASYGTQHEGKVSTIMASLIESILEEDTTFNENNGFLTIEQQTDYTLYGTNEQVL